MTTKDYLNQIRDMRQKIKRTQENIDAKRELLTSISVKSDGERVQSSSDPDKMAMMVADILDREAELQVFISNYIQKEREIAYQIDSLEDWHSRELLQWRYVQCETFEKIAGDRMNITFRHIMRLHKIALRDFENKYGEFYR